MSNRTEPRETTEGSRLRRTGEWLATSRTTGIAAAVFCALLAVVVAVAVFIAVTRDDDSAGSGAPLPPSRPRRHQQNPTAHCIRRSVGGSVRPRDRQPRQPAWSGVAAVVGRSPLVQGR
ncbi:hypothetical protein QV65_03555 [Rhodococcus erythropolis]|nr:hypothetical protein QV65_03555 [Rhodococcus erythropolis]